MPNALIVCSKFDEIRNFYDNTFIKREFYNFCLTIICGKFLLFIDIDNKFNCIKLIFFIK